jgi:hypothetical protein
VNKHVRWIVLLSVIAALAVFLVVQDRVTAAGARRYVALQRSAIAGRTPRVTIDEVMRPAVERAVRQASLWGGLVLLAGLGTAAAASRRKGRGQTQPAPARRVAERPDVAKADDRRE